MLPRLVRCASFTARSAKLLTPHTSHLAPRTSPLAQPLAQTLHQRARVDWLDQHVATPGVEASASRFDVIASGERNDDDSRIIGLQQREQTETAAIRQGEVEQHERW